MDAKKKFQSLYFFKIINILIYFTSYSFLYLIILHLLSITQIQLTSLLLMNKHNCTYAEN